MKKIFLIVVVFLLCFPSWVLAATYNASSCSRDDVATAVGLSSDGDTVVLPTCAEGVGWSSNLTVNKAITIQGQGIGQTVLIDNVSGAMLTMDVDNKAYRITGIEFRGGTGDTFVLALRGQARGFRLDNCRFFDWAGRAIEFNDDVRGVIYDCDFDKNSKWSQAFLIFHRIWEGVGDYGDNSWADDDHLGTDKFIFIEDCDFIGFDTTPYNPIIDAYQGARFVFRYNTVTNDFIASHGTESGQRIRGLRAFEIYENTFNSSVQHFTANYIRGGTGVIYNNTLGGSGSHSSVAALANFRTHTSYPPWGQCDGSSPYDQNVGTPNGYACIDQVGRGIGDYISGATPTEAWPNQALSPVYMWGNSGWAVQQVALDSAHIVLNRDVYVGTEKPDYVAYEYPHPLRGEGDPSISAPSGLRVVGGWSWK